MFKFPKLFSLIILIVILISFNHKFCDGRRIRQEVIFPVKQEINKEELEEILKYLIPGVKGIVLDCIGTLMNPIDLKIDKEMAELLKKIIAKNIPIAILTTLPSWTLKLLVLQYLPKDFAERIFIGGKKDITDFMESRKLNPEDLLLIIDEPIGRDLPLIELAGEAWVINVGRFYENLPDKILTSKIKGPEATKIILEIIDRYK